MYQLSNDIKSTLDILGINHYRCINSKLDKTTFEDSFKSWNNNAAYKVLDYLKKKYQDKEIIISETGVQDYWEALAKPENFTWQNPTPANGKSQDIYLYGLLETCPEIDAVCWWYNFAYEDGLTSKRLQQYLGGATINE